MKKFILRLAIFVIVSLSPISAPAGNNIVGPTPLPTTLPIGDNDTVMTGIVTNYMMSNTVVNVYLKYKDTNGVWQSTPNGYFGWKQYTSLSAFKAD